MSSQSQQNYMFSRQFTVPYFRRKIAEVISGHLGFKMYKVHRGLGENGQLPNYMFKHPSAEQQNSYFLHLSVLTRVRGKFLVVLGLGKWLDLAKNVLSLTVLTKRDGPGHVTILIAISKNYLTSCRPYKDIIRILVSIRIF